MYYRVKCLQNGNYMGWGYNSKTLQQLCSEYLDYKSIDWDEEETENYYRNLPIWQVVSLIEEDEFKIEESKTKFNEEIPKKNCLF